MKLLITNKIFFNDFRIIVALGMFKTSEYVF